MGGDRALAADEEVTVLLTTHYLDEADRTADRLAIVDAGRVVVEGTPDALKRELHGDTVQVELARARRSSPGLAALRRAARSGGRSSRTGRRCARGRTAARPPSRPSSRR